MKKKWQLNVVLKMIAAFFVIPLVFSTFFSGYKVISEGVQKNAPVEVSLFEYVSKGDILLTFAFVCTILMFLLILAIIVFSMINVSKKQNDRFIGILLCSFQLVLTVMSFVIMIIFCAKNTVKGDVYSLKYMLGASTIIYFVCGMLFGVLSMMSYLVKVKKPVKKSVKQTG